MTGLASNLTIQNPLGNNDFYGQTLLIRIKDDGTPRTLSWGVNFIGVVEALPTTTVAGKEQYFLFIFRETGGGDWDFIGKAVQP